MATAFWGLRYALCLVRYALCVMRYDNEAGKGDHRLLNAAEKAWQFFTRDKLFADSERDILRPQDEDTHVSVHLPPADHLKRWQQPN